MKVLAVVVLVLCVVLIPPVVMLIMSLPRGINFLVMVAVGLLWIVFIRSAIRILRGKFFVKLLSWSRPRRRPGEKDQAFEQLEKAYQEHDWILTAPKVTPAWDPLRDDPRFHDLRRRMKLEA